MKDNVSSYEKKCIKTKRNTSINPPFKTFIAKIKSNVGANLSFSALECTFSAYI